MLNKDLHVLSAVEAADAIRAGRITSEDLVKACLNQIGDDTIMAWAYLDAEFALDQARDLDRSQKAGRVFGPLHGVPVGLKDIIDTRLMPTECGTAIFVGRKPEQDATIVNRLHEAGAVIMGKTKTTELAFVHPTDTLNPFDAARSPGGSSSGSAAAVAAYHVPLAVGSQTGGSVVRPASYCGIHGLKPSRGLVSRSGVLQTSVSLDHVGSFARNVEDVALLTGVISSFDPSDCASFESPRPDLLAAMQAELPADPKIAFFDFPFHDMLDGDARKGLDWVGKTLGSRVKRLPVPDELDGLIEVHLTIYEYEFCKHFKDIIDNHWDDLSDSLKPIVIRGRDISQAAYEAALVRKEAAEAYLEKHFQEFDVILAPSATGEAPLLSEGTTGDPVFCRLWSLTGLPAVTMPLLTGQNNLPIGVQLIGGLGADDRLLRNAAWVQKRLSD